MPAFRPHLQKNVDLAYLCLKKCREWRFKHWMFMAISRYKLFLRYQVWFLLLKYLVFPKYWKWKWRGAECGIEHNSLMFLGVPWRAGFTGLRSAAVLRCSPHWLTPPLQSLTRFATRTSDDDPPKKTPLSPKTPKETLHQNPFCFGQFKHNRHNTMLAYSLFVAGSGYPMWHFFDHLQGFDI